MSRMVALPQSEPGRTEAVVISDDKRVVVCWHPEPIIPYSATQVLAITE